MSWFAGVGLGHAVEIYLPPAPRARVCGFLPLVRLAVTKHKMILMLRLVLFERVS